MRPPRMSSLKAVLAVHPTRPALALAHAARMAPGAASSATKADSEALHPYAQKYLAVKRTGDANLDESAEALRTCAQQVVNWLLEDPAKALPLHQQMLKKRQRSAKLVTALPPSDRFKHISIIGKLELAFVVGAVVELSDLSADDVLEASKHDDAAPRQLLSFGTLWSYSLRVPGEAIVKEVLMDLIKQRAATMGGRLRNFKAGGGVHKDGSINWKRGAYRLEFESDDDSAKLVKISHVSGAWVAVSNSSIDRSWTLGCNWLDHEATLTHRPLKPTTVVTFFDDKEKSGPHCQRKASGVNKEFNSAAKAVAERFWKQLQHKAEAAAGNDEVSSKLDKLAQDRRRELLEEQRKRVSDVVATSKKRRTLTLTKSDP